MDISKPGGLIMVIKFGIKLLFISLVFYIFASFSAICVSEDGGEAGAFLKNGIGVRPISMGKAFVAIADDANAGYWNPSGLAQLNSPQVTTMYSNPMNFALGGSGIKDIGYHTVGLAYPTPYGSVGLNLAYLSVGNIQEVKKDESGEIVFGDTFEDKEMAIILSYGASIIDELHLGLNLKYISQQIWDNKGSGMGLDIGALYEPIYNLTFGLALQDLIEPKIKLLEDGVTNSIPRKIRFGLSYRLLDDMILLAADINKASNRSAKFHIGTEVEPMKDLALRGGYTTDTGEITAGVGVRVSIVQLDYGFGFMKLGSTHRISLTLDFARLTQKGK